MKTAGVAILLAGLALFTGPQQPPGPPGLVRAGEYRLDATRGGAAPAASAGSVYDVGPFPLSPPELPLGEGRDATAAMCAVCHSLRYITMQPPFPAETWRATVRKMVDVHGAPIPDDVVERITKYLQEHFGPAK